MAKVGAPTLHELVSGLTSQQLQLVDPHGFIRAFLLSCGNQVPPAVTGIPGPHGTVVVRSNIRDTIEGIRQRGGPPVPYGPWMGQQASEDAAHPDAREILAVVRRSVPGIAAAIRPLNSWIAYRSRSI